MLNVQTIPGIEPLNHIGWWIQILSNLSQTMPWLSYILIIGNLFSNKNNSTFNLQYIFIQLHIFFQIKAGKKILWSSQNAWFLCSRCSTMHQIECTFFTNFPGCHPRLPFGAGTQYRAPPLQNPSCVPGLDKLYQPLSEDTVV